MKPFKALAVLGAVLVAFATSARAESPTNPPGTVSTSWVGNSFMSSNGTQWVPDELSDIYVDPAGNVFACGYNESGGSGAQYRNGAYVGNYSGFNSGFGDPTTCVVSNGTNVYWGDAGGVQVYGYGGGTSPITSFLSGSQVTGLAIHGSSLYISDYTNNLIRVYSLSSLTQTAQWSMTRPGAMAVDQNGNVWVIQYSSGTVLGGTVTGTQVLSFTSSGGAGSSITDAGDPLAIAVNNSNQLLIGGRDTNSQVRIYNLSGTSASFSSAFGTQGGIFAGTPGQPLPGKFHWIKGLGVDSSNNIYVGETFGSAVWGQVVDVYNSSGTRLWAVFGGDYVDSAGIDPSNETEVYDTYHHYSLDYSQINGGEWSLSGFTLNPFKYPNDPRMLGGSGPGFRQGSGMVRIQGKPFLVTSDQASYGLDLYRFNTSTDGEVAIPSVEFNGGSTTTIATDSNGNGQYDTGETASGTSAYQQYFDVDSSGDVITTGNASGPSTIIEYPCQGLDGLGNPLYTAATALSWNEPAAFGSIRRAHYDKANDTMYLGGRTVSDNDEGFDHVGCYTHWSTGPVQQWFVSLPYNDQAYTPDTTYGGGMPTVLKQAGNYVFIAYGYGYIRILNKTTGATVGTLRPLVGGFGGGGGQLDGNEALTAFQRANHEYVLLLEDTGHNHVVMVRWNDGTETGVVATPTFSPGTGAYTTNQSVTISDASSGATIHYTTNGSTPTPASAVYSSPISVSSTAIIRAFAQKSAMTSSPVSSATYTYDTPVYQINLGGPAASPYVADEFGSGANTGTANTTIDTSHVPNPAPQAVYQTYNWGPMTYTITGLTAGASYIVRLHQAEYTDTTTGERQYNVAINGTTVLSNYDIVADAGQINIATVKSFPATATSSGQIVINFTQGAADNPVCSGIEILKSTGTGGGGTVATPTFSPGAGTYSSPQSVILSDTTAGSTIYYTTNGSTPTTSSTQYTTAINVSSSETIKAIAAASGMTNSSVASAAYTITVPTAATPTFSPGAGTYTSTQSVTISDTTSGAVIHYTTDGSTPTASSATYSSAISVASTETLKAIAIASGYSNSAVGSAAYTINSGGTTAVYQINVGGPAVSPYSADQFGSGGNVATITNAVDTSLVTSPAPQAVYQSERWGAMTYTITGLTSGSSYTVRLHMLEYTDAGVGQRKFNVAINGTSVLTNYDVYAAAGALYKAVVQSFTATANTSGQIVIAFTLGAADNPVCSGIEVLTGGTATAATPTFSPAAGTYTSAQSVTLSDTTSGASIYYTTDGSTPTTSSTHYTGAINVSATMTIKAIAAASGYTNSAVGSATYTINLPTAATPTFSPAGGSYSSAQSVTLSDTTSGSSIYYTTDGSTPTTSSTHYTAAINVSSTTTIKAIAAASGYINSTVGSATYTIGALTAVDQINVGGAAASPYVADKFGSGGNVATITNTVDTSLVTTPAPQAVYKSERWGAMTYTITGLTAGSSYTVRLHMVEYTDPGVGQRKFNVAINGTSVLSNYDIYAVTGALYKAVAPSFTTTANSSGQIVIAFTLGTADNPVCSGIEVLH